MGPAKGFHRRVCSGPGAPSPVPALGQAGFLQSPPRAAGSRGCGESQRPSSTPGEPRKHPTRFQPPGPTFCLRGWGLRLEARECRRAPPPSPRSCACARPGRLHCARAQNPRGPGSGAREAAAGGPLEVRSGAAGGSAAATGDRAGQRGAPFGLWSAPPRSQPAVPRGPEEAGAAGARGAPGRAGGARVPVGRLAVLGGPRARRRGGTRSPAAACSRRPPWGGVAHP